MTVAERKACDTLVIGVGNEFRGDDGAGLLVVRALAACAGDAARMLELPGEGTELIEAWRGEGRVIVVDASCSGIASGTITRLDAHTEVLSQGFFNSSTHAFGLAEAVETSRNLNILPQQLIIYAIEGHAFGQGEHLTAGIEEAVSDVVDMILKDIS